VKTLGQHCYQVYPYLLRGVTVTKPNQVWGTDISVPQQAA